MTVQSKESCHMKNAAQYLIIIMTSPIPVGGHYSLLGRLNVVYRSVFQILQPDPNSLLSKPIEEKRLK